MERCNFNFKGRLIMSTRANIIIKDSYSKLYFYRHSDGYPEVTGKSLKSFVKKYTKNKFRLDATQSAGWLIIKGYQEYFKYKKSLFDSDWKVGAYEPTTKIHGDIEYLYIIDLDTRELKMISGQKETLKPFKTVRF